MKKATFLVSVLLLVILSFYSQTSIAFAYSHSSNQALIPQYSSQNHSDPLGKLIIQNRSSYDALVKVVNTVTNRAAYKVHVQAHQDYTLDGVADGRYVLAFVLAGSADQSNTRLTGGFAKQFVDVLTFTTTETDEGTRYVVYTATFYVTGVFSSPTKDISLEEFNSY